MEMSDGMNKQLNTDKVTTYFQHLADIVTVYLFGSYAKGKQRSNSDMDLGLVFQHGMDEMERFERKLEIASDLEDLLDIPVDVVDLCSADPFFLHQVLLSKELLVERSTEQRVAFEVESRRRYFDMQPVYERYHREALKRLEEYHG